MLSWWEDIGMGCTFSWCMVLCTMKGHFWDHLQESSEESLSQCFPFRNKQLVQMALWCSVFGWEQSRWSVASYEWRIQNYISIETLPTQSSFLCIAFPRCHSCITVWRLCSFLLSFPLLFTNVIPKKSKWGVPESCHSTTLLEADSFFKKF